MHTHRRTPRLAILSLAVAALLPSLGVAAESVGAASSPKTTSITLRQEAPYKPSAENGGTDDYHCTLVNPHVKRDSYIVSSQFYPNSPQVHHAILFLIPPDVVAAAKAADNGGKGWTCFGETALPGTTIAQIAQTPWLSAWAPGHGKDVHTKGAGTLMPAGSRVVMQIHYNMLRGDKPVSSRLVLNTVPVTKSIQPETLGQYIAIPNVPCPTGVTGPLCDRTAARADIANRFGVHAIEFNDVVQRICGQNPAAPVEGNTVTCIWHPRQEGYVVRVAPHMHLIGKSESMVLNPNSAHPTTLMNIKSYNFDDQRAYALKKPIKIGANDEVKLTCTYDPTLRQKLPQLRTQPARYVTWGDGSSDEMCLGLVMTVPKKPATK